MPDSASVEEYRKRSLERVTAFTDAAVAIALTLLVLPLVDLATDVETGQSVLHVLAEHRGDLLGYLVSFLVIAQFWNGHRRLFETLDVYDERLLAINTWWLLFVVFLPYPTARLFVASRVDRGGAVLYLGTLLVISLLGLALTWYAARHCELRRPDLPPAPVRDQIRVNVGISAVMAVGLALAFVQPQLGLYALLLLVLVGNGPRFARRRAVPPHDQGTDTRP
jgi:uncharacterized membrane protein